MKNQYLADIGDYCKQRTGPFGTDPYSSSAQQAVSDLSGPPAGLSKRGAFRRRLFPFEACSRNIDYKRLCLMLYYLAHYTRLRNENKDESINLDEALRPYDLEDMNLSVTSVGDVTYYKSAIKIKIHNYDGSVRGEQYMPLHIKSDVNPRSLIRIYFLYHKPIGKSIIGYMPDHIDKV